MGHQTAPQAVVGGVWEGRVLPDVYGEGSHAGWANHAADRHRGAQLFVLRGKLVAKELRRQWSAQTCRLGPHRSQVVAAR